MQMKTNNKKRGCKSVSAQTLSIKDLILSAVLWMALPMLMQAQETSSFSPSPVRIGIAAGANFNFYRGSTQMLNSTFTAPVAFNYADGAGFFIAPLIEYVHPTSGLGVALQVGFDGRQSAFNEEITPCNCPAGLTTKLNYVTVEPTLRVAPFGSNFYLFGGPRMAFNVDKSFTYKLGINPAFPDQAPTPDVKGDLSDVTPTLVSMQVGAGYDIPLSTPEHPMQAFLSPFISFQPYFGQKPRSVETWNITTLRVGAALKFGHGKKDPAPTSTTTTPQPITNNVAVDPPIQFFVNSPKNIPVERRVRETFPLRNYVFFDLGSTEIPDRYMLISKDQVKDFKEDQLEVFTPKTLSGRSARGMTVYYNLLNILGDRMGKNPGTAITLVGSSEKGPEDGRLMAESVQRYLVDVFNINNSRIAIEGRTKPSIPSEQPGGTQELDLLREGDRRVSIVSTSPALLMEFQTGPEVFLKPVEYTAVQEAPYDSYVTFYVMGGNEALNSWSMAIKDDKNGVQSFGPYTRESVSLPGKTILGTRPSGHFSVLMTGKTKTGKTVTKEAAVDIALWTPPTNEEGMRFSVIYEFNESKAISIYEKYLNDVVIPKIPQNGTVIIHGHTDIIGDDTYNQKLSLARANNVKSILESGLLKAGRSDVKFLTSGSGEDENLSPFANNFPEERFYNRTVIIDIVPRN
jgi:outer membrane protein OmpA-like peptidoglycan-associated protein